MLLNRGHWCVNGTGLMPTNTLLRIWIQTYDFLLHIHVQEVTMSGQNLYKLHMVTNSYVLEAAAEMKNKDKNCLRKAPSPSALVRFPSLNWHMEDREFLVCCSLWAHILLILPKSTICRDLGVSCRERQQLKLFPELSDF